MVKKDEKKIRGYPFSMDKNVKFEKKDDDDEIFGNDRPKRYGVFDRN